MANATPCQTNDAVFDTFVGLYNVSVSVKLPFRLDLTEEEAATLETNMHNVMELVLAPYFKK